MDDVETSLNTDWITEAETLSYASDVYGPIPEIRLVLILPSGEYRIHNIPRSDFESLNISTFFDKRTPETGGMVFDKRTPETGVFDIKENNMVVREIALFSFSIQKHQLTTLSASAYESIDSIEQLRERLIGLKSLPYFVDLFEIIVSLDTVSILKGKGNNNGKKTRKHVRFHHSCTRRQLN